MPGGRLLILFLCLSALLGCADHHRATVLTPDGPLPRVEWSAEELNKDIAFRPLRATDAAGYAIVRLRGQEKPHVHDRSDLTVIILTGKVLMRLDDRSVELGPGDVIDIPRGVVHWARNLHPVASEAYLVSTPPLDRDDALAVSP